MLSQSVPIHNPNLIEDKPVLARQTSYGVLRGKPRSDLSALGLFLADFRLGCVSLAV